MMSFSLCFAFLLHQIKPIIMCYIHLPLKFVDALRVKILQTLCLKSHTDMNPTQHGILGRLWAFG